MVELKGTHDTICAIATPVGEGGVGIIKISGPEATAIARRLFLRSGSGSGLESHRLYHGWIKDPVTGQSLDEVLVGTMAAPHTYTREDVVEINCHSGFAVLNRILELVLREGARLADPGEFTRRAFLNGRIDLSQAEAVIEVIRSRSEQGLLLANRLLRGALGEKVRSWREGLLELQSRIEATIDFEDDLDEDALCGVSDRARFVTRLDGELIPALSAALESAERSRALREGVSLVLAGKPNVGKSSLLNALVGRDRAIVTPFPGTTRDVVEDTFLLSGILVKVLDTAGLRHDPDEIESFGIARTIQSVEEADIVLCVMDRSRPLSVEDDAVVEAVASRPFVIVLNKEDLPPAISTGEIRERYGENVPIVAISALRPPDVERLRDFLNQRFLRLPLEQSGSAIVPNLRQRGCIEKALQALIRARDLISGGGFWELASAELQTARNELDSVLGWNGDDALLDRIFSDFCIGK
ncbi:MAG TPA: tRNA uridine-5-carboxymethylaminomethyl(34) synthesis GTPase MnmE [Syntrophobacter fumaroxidans]|nr:tRNA uridine-5-carboxymethylaminomethyl(34) synthesis GTPase MnmE [Syntrophobacter fumaroxidans]